MPYLCSTCLKEHKTGQICWFAIKSCEYCHATFTKSLKESYAQFNKRRFCSRTCKAIKLRPTTFNNYISGIRVYRKIMEAHLGRPLKENEVVHHIDGNRKNNTIDNLALMTNEAHSRLHALQNKLGHDKKYYRKRDEKGKFLCKKKSA